MNLADLLKDRDRVVNRHTVPVLMSTDAADRCVAANERLTIARATHARALAVEQGMMAKPETERAQQALDDASAEVESAETEASGHLVDFVFESVSSTAWERLVTEHPATKDQAADPALQDRLGRGPTWNPSTFPIAAVAACLVEPNVETVAEVEKLKDSIPDIVWQQLWGAVLRVNRGMNQVPPSLAASNRTRTSEK